MTPRHPVAIVHRVRGRGGPTSERYQLRPIRLSDLPTILRQRWSLLQKGEVSRLRVRRCLKVVRPWFRREFRKHRIGGAHGRRCSGTRHHNRADVAATQTSESPVLANRDSVPLVDVHRTLPPSSGYGFQSRPRADRPGSRVGYPAVELHSTPLPWPEVSTNAEVSYRSPATTWGEGQSLPPQVAWGTLALGGALG